MKVRRCYGGLKPDRLKMNALYLYKLGEKCFGLRIEQSLAKLMDKFVPTLNQSKKNGCLGKHTRGYRNKMNELYVCCRLRILETEINDYHRHATYFPRVNW